MKRVVDFFKDEEKRTLLFLALSALSLAISFFEIGNFKVDPAWIGIILCGIPIIKGALEGLIQEFDIKADVLVALALVASVLIGENFAAGEVAFIMTLGALLEERTVAKARAGIEKLVQLTPPTARILKDGIETIIPAEKVQVNDILRILPGETIAVDGLILSGQTSINQSVMTGESLPIDKGVGDEVFSGTLNQFGSFDMQATKVGEDSSLQKMIRLVESADASKAEIVGLADRWATWIVVIALLSALGTWMATGEVIRAVTILVVFCPCALVLATPTAIMAGIGNATKFGILVREGDALERLSKVTRIAFDKTGTLTYGSPIVVAVESFHGDIPSDKLLFLTASAELRSEHPLGKAILSHFKPISDISLIEPRSFTMVAGRGVQAVIEEDVILAGSAELLLENDIPLSQDLLEKASTYKNQGCTLIYIAINGSQAGFIALSDTLREESKEIISKLHALNIKSMLLTGDNPQAASYIAESIGISQVHAECLPQDKMAMMEQYQNQNEMICMVGDGINDAPALKKAYVGVAMGGIGSDIAVDAADVALMGDNIKALPHLLRLSQKTMKTIKINILLSLLLNFAAILLAMTGLLGPVLGALVHNLGSVVVIIHSAFLLNFKEDRNRVELPLHPSLYSNRSSS